MADLKVHIEKITGQPSDAAGCGVLTKRVTLSDGSVGTLVSCIMVKGEGVEPSDVLRDVFDIGQRKLEEAEGGILSALQSAVAQSKNYNPNLDIHLVHTFFWQDVCYVARLGNQVKIFVFDPPKSLELKFESGSGPVSDGQMYLIATEAFLSIFDISVFEQEAEVDFGELIDGVATEIAGEANQSEIGAAFVAASVVEEEIEELPKQDFDGVDAVDEDLKSDNDNLDEQIGDVVKVEEEVAEHTSEIAGDKKAFEEASESAFALPPDAVETAAPVVSTEHEEEYRQTEYEERSVISPPVEKGDSIVKKLLSKVGGEVSKVRHGDIGAIRKNIVVLALIAIVVLGSSVGFAVYKKGLNEKNSLFNTHMTEASSKYEQASAVIGLSKVRARDLLIDADREVKLALEIKGEDETAKRLSSDISQKLKETEVASSVNFDEVASVEGRVNSLGIAGKNIIGVSSEGLYIVNPADGDVDKVELKAAADSGFVYDNKVFFTGDGKVARQDIVGGKIVDVGSSNGALDISVFFGNVYVLGTSSIDKFTPVEGGYSQPISYLNESQTFTPKSHLAIDASIWVTSGSNILKFTRGDKEDFSIKGSVGGVGELSLIYTNADLDNLYVVDVTNSALLVVGKDGDLKKILQDGQFGRASDIIVDEGEKTVYLAVGDRIVGAAL